MKETTQEHIGSESVKMMIKGKKPNLMRKSDSENNHKDATRTRKQ